MKDKYCPKCGVYMTLENSCTRKTKYGTLIWAAYCKRCSNALKKEYYWSDDDRLACHRSNILVRNKEWREKLPQGWAAYMKEYKKTYKKGKAR